MGFMMLGGSRGGCFNKQRLRSGFIGKSFQGQYCAVSTQTKRDQNKGGGDAPWMVGVYRQRRQCATTITEI